MADDKLRAEAAVRDWRQADLPATDKALCAFAEKLSATPGRMTGADVEALRATSLSDEAIHDAVQVIAYFNYINRIADGLGTDLEPEMPPPPKHWQPPAFACPDATTDPALSLDEITKENLRRVLSLEVSPLQRHFVASNPVSLAQAHVESQMRCSAITAAGVPVGFVMLEPESDGRTIFIVRFMIDHRAQGRGFGARALDLVIEQAFAQPGIERVTLSYVPGDGSPKPFYERVGFRETGEIVDDEIVMERLKDPRSPAP